MLALPHMFAALLLALVQGAGVPTNEGWVTDTAGVLSGEQERALEAQLEAYKAGTTNEIAVLVVRKLGGTSIEKLALDAGRQWKVGLADKANGVVLAVAVDDHKLRIEVGPGLGGLLTDAQSGRIIRDVIAPRFRKNDYFGGLRDGLLAIQGALGGEAAPGSLTATRSSPLGALAGLVPVLLVVFLLLAARRRGGHGGGGVGTALILGSMLGGRHGGGGGRGGGGFGGGFGGFGGGGRFGGGGASGGW